MSRRSRKGRPLDGILLLDKPLGISSNRALQIVKRLLDAQKAGHTGSLDPLATGMLPLCFGEATKVSAYLLDSNKEYTTEARLGIKTASGDSEGEVIREQPVAEFSIEEILAVLARFTGQISQVPPMYSALKVGGKTLYKLARKGLEIQRNSRLINIFDIELLSVDLPVLQLRVRCSKGTYIRTLIEDIGETLGCGAHVQRLHRTEVAPFVGEKMWTIDELEELAAQGSGPLDNCLMPSDIALKHLPEIRLDPAQQILFQAGRTIAPEKVSPDTPDQIHRTYGDDRVFLGLSLIDADGQLHPKRVFRVSTT